MILQMLLSLVVTAANLVADVDCTKIEFPADVLSFDLHAISQYYQKFEERPPAYVRLPNEVTFEIRMKKNEYLKVYGIFKRLKDRKFSIIPHNGLYYKNGRFFIKDRIKGLKELLSNTLIRYEQPSLKSKHVETQGRVLITYFGLAELERDAKSFYLSNKQYLDDLISHSSPSTFLTPSSVVQNTYGHFLEYTLLSKDNPSTVPLADGLLRVLTGTKVGETLSLTSNTKAFRLVFNTEKLKFTVHERVSLDSEPLANVFGIRMDQAGFLSRVYNGGELKVFGSRDLACEGPLPIQSPTFFYDLLQKVKSVEPRLSYFLSTSKRNDALKQVRFQVHGQILIKIVNWSFGRIDEDCPLTLIFERRKFWIDGHWEERICTDESKLWLQTKDGPSPIKAESMSEEANLEES